MVYCVSYHKCKQKFWERHFPFTTPQPTPTPTPTLTPTLTPISRITLHFIQRDPRSGVRQSQL
ncbi:MAG: hypothetical protein J7L89_07315 [Bacteroidales bacterium]|nr:hypothetical protein [Bacteroidales bacterium]